MKAVIFDKKSPTERLVISEIDKPVPKEGEVLVKINSVSINAADYRMMQLGFAPKSKIFGSDISGVIESVGPNVKNLQIGDSVMGELADCGFGGFAEYVAVSENVLIHKPQNISFDEAAALPMASSVALKGLRNVGKIQNKNKVLIVGCSGGVGTYAIQLAKYWEAEVTGVCSTRNVEQSYSLGADKIIDYKKEDLTKIADRFDLILGINGNYSLTSYKRLLRKNGRYVNIGGSLKQIFKSIFFGWFLSLGSKKILILSAKSNLQDLKFVTNLAKEGKIKPVIDKSYKIDEIFDAIKYIKNQHAKGKIVIQVS